MNQVDPSGNSIPPEPPLVMAQAVTPEQLPPVASGSKSSATKVILYVVGGFGLMFMVCCGACCGFGFWNDQQKYREMAPRLIVEYRDHPIVQEQLGGIDSCEPKVWEEFGAFRTHDKAFEVSGPKGKGRLLVDELFGKTVAVYLRVGDDELELTKTKEAETPTSNDR